VHRIDRQDRPGQVQDLQKRSDRGDLIGLGRDRDLTEHDTGSVVERRDQMRRHPAPGTGATHGLPSTAITRRPATRRVTVHIHAPITASNTSGSRRANNRRNTDSFGIRRRSSSPNATATDASWSASHCAIAANERAPARVDAIPAATRPISG
jgi:hypothetical protein